MTESNSLTASQTAAAAAGKSTSAGHQQHHHSRQKISSHRPASSHGTTSLRKRQLDTSSSVDMPGVDQEIMMLGNQSEAHSVAELRDAIIELYLAIKIRSTEEVSTIYLCLHGRHFCIKRLKFFAHLSITVY